MRDFVLIVDCGSQTTQLIARCVRSGFDPERDTGTGTATLGTFCEIVSADTAATPEALHAWLGEHDVSLPAQSQSTCSFVLRGVILSGGPASSVSLCHADFPDLAALSPEERDALPPIVSPAAIDSLGVPVLGICYGFQVTVALRGGTVTPAEGQAEYGKTAVRPSSGDAGLELQRGLQLFSGLDPAAGNLDVWMSHGDQVASWDGTDVVVLGSSDTCPYAAAYVPSLNFWGVQFHPEVKHTPGGARMLANFVNSICGCTGSWKTGGEEFVAHAVSQVRAQVGDDNVLLGVSGGVDSSVVAKLLYQAIGKQLWCVFVDNGLLREGEAEQVREMFANHLPEAHFTFVDASDQFLEKLAGVTDPERKRKIIGHEFVEVFVRTAAEIKREAAAGTNHEIKFLAQGTLYPDVIESQPVRGARSHVIKTHHNVGGLPATLKLGLVEPLRELFKDEVRELGEFLQLPESIVWRQPFPGPGLAVRILGDITRPKLATLRRADAIMREEMDKAGLARVIWQALVVLTPVNTVGVMGDGRTYEDNVVAAVRAVVSTDGMTADWYRWPYDVIDRISSRIVNEVRGISRVVMDVTSKPPGTIEWE